MKNNTKKIWIGIGILFAILLLVVAIFALPKAKTGSEIAALLKPVITTENQSMDAHLQFMISGNESNIDFTIYWLREDKKMYIVMEQDNHPVYIVDNVLYLENGHAFLIHDEETEIKSMDAQMFAQIAALYEALDITTTKADDAETYSIEVSGEEAKSLIGHAMPDIFSELSEIDNLKVNLTAKEDVLTSVSYSGGATINGKEMALQMEVDNFRVLESGEYVIPEEIQDAVQNEKKDALFSISKDLYRLMMAFADLASQESIEGTVKVSANSGIVNFKKTYDLSELRTSKTDLENAEEIEKLPDMIALLCMEGEISCEEEADGYHYTLKLNKQTMGEITEMLLPESVSQFIKLSKGNVEILVNGSKMKSIEIGIAGTLQSLFSKVQSQVGVEFVFD